MRIIKYCPYIHKHVRYQKTIESKPKRMTSGELIYFLTYCLNTHHNLMAKTIKAIVPIVRPAITFFCIIANKKIKPTKKILFLTFF